MLTENRKDFPMFYCLVTLLIILLCSCIASCSVFKKTGLNSRDHRNPPLDCFAASPIQLITDRILDSLMHFPLCQNSSVVLAPLSSF